MGVIIHILVLLVFLVFMFFIISTTGDDGDDTKELFHKYGSFYLEDLERELSKSKIAYERINKLLNNIQTQIDTCAMVFEEYFAQDQTNDDLLVLAFEELKKMRSVGTSEYEIDKNEEKILKDALRTMEKQLRKLKK